MLLADRLAHPLGRRFLTPLDFDENLMGWWDASTLRLDDTDPVATWPDLSGNGLDFAQSSSGLRPSFAARAHNGRGAVRFDDSSEQYLDTDTFSAVSQPFTALVVCQSSSAAGYTILNGTTNNRIALGSFNASRSDLIAWAGDTQYSALPGATWPLSVIAAYFNTDNSITWDITGRRFSVGSAGSNTVTSFRLGRHQTDSTRRFNGDICELAIWARALPADELGSLARDLAAKWGI